MDMQFARSADTRPVRQSDRTPWRIISSSGAETAKRSILWKLTVASARWLAGADELPCVGGTSAPVFVLHGFITRLASIPLIVIMLIAIATTKTEILANQGIWKMMHESRTDWAMLLGSIFLLINGGGFWSLDRTLMKWENSAEVKSITNKEKWILKF